MNAAKLYFSRWISAGPFRAGFDLLCLGLFVFGVFFYVSTLKSGLHITVLGDETEKYVAAQLIVEGAHLYSEIFAHHGPVPFIISHLYAVGVSKSDFTMIRMVMPAIAFLSLLALMFSPVIERFSVRLIVGGIYLVLLSSVWLLQGIHMVLYQQIAGFMFSVILTQLVLPAILDKRPSRFGLFLSGGSGAIACFCAYSYGPATLLLLVSGVFPLCYRHPEKRGTILALAGGFLAVTLLVIGWLVVFGDLRGYLVYHFYFNQIVYAPFIDGFSLTGLLQNLLLNFEPFAVMQSIAVLGFIVWFFALIARALLLSGKNTPAEEGAGDAVKIQGRLGFGIFPLVLLLGGFLFANPRGEVSFQANALIILGLSGFPLVLGFFLEKGLERKNVAAPSILVLVALSTMALANFQGTRALSNPYGLKLQEYLAQPAFLKPVPGTVFDLLGNDDRILALVFCPNVYLTSGHLPASGNLCYLPWQARYDAKPVWNYKRDLCADIKNNAPKIIYYDGWKVWNRYSLDEYGPEVVDLLAKNYRKMSGHSGYYFRNDLFQGLAADDGDHDFRSEASPLLGAESPLTLHLVDHHGKKINRMGIKLGTRGQARTGVAVMRLLAADGSETQKEFRLEFVKGQEYYFFELPPGVYLSGQILSINGGGINTWDVTGNPGNTYTAIIYGFEDGTFSFSPGAESF